MIITYHLLYFGCRLNGSSIINILSQKQLQPCKVILSLFYGSGDRSLEWLSELIKAIHLTGNQDLIPNVFDPLNPHSHHCGLTLTILLGLLSPIQAVGREGIIFSIGDFSRGVSLWHNTGQGLRCLYCSVSFGELFPFIGSETTTRVSSTAPLLSPVL